MGPPTVKTARKLFVANALLVLSHVKKVVQGPSLSTSKVINLSKLVIFSTEFSLDHHFDICGNQERKRKVKSELKEEEASKKAKEIDRNKQFWAKVSKKTVNNNDEKEDSDNDLVVDEDLIDDSVRVEDCG